MYVHIGGEYSIATKMIIGIFDLDQITNTPKRESLNLLQKLEDNFQLEIVSPEIPRSLVLTLDRAYLSPISSNTLKSRIDERSFS